MRASVEGQRNRKRGLHTATHKRTRISCRYLLYLSLDQMHACVHFRRVRINVRSFIHSQETHFEEINHTYVFVRVHIYMYKYDYQASCNKIITLNTCGLRRAFIVEPCISRPVCNAASDLHAQFTLTFKCAN